MISQRDIVTLKVPYPSITSGLVKRAHMYICKVPGQDKEFVKCQTFKPMHRVPNRPPFNFIIEPANSLRNPFNGSTTIDCDKVFSINSIRIPQALCTNKNACEELFADILSKLSSVNYSNEVIDTTLLLTVNSMLSNW